MMSKKDYIIEQRRRKEDQQLQHIGPIEEEVRILEYRDVWIERDGNKPGSRNKTTEEDPTKENRPAGDAKEETETTKESTDPKETLLKVPQSEETPPAVKETPLKTPQS